MMTNSPTVSQLRHEISCGNVAQARLLADDVVRIQADNAEAWFLRGLAEHLAGDVASAVRSYERSMSLAPDYFDPLNNLSVLYLSLGRVDESFALSERHVRHQPNSPIANSNYANTLVRLGRYDEAADHYRRAIAAKPDYYDAHANFGSLLLTMKQPHEAVNHFQRALELRPNTEIPHRCLGQALAHAEKFESAKVHLREALRINPHSVETWTDLGASIAKLGDKNGAIDCFRQALAIQPTNALATFNLGTTLNEIGQTEQALDYLGRAIELQPDMVSAHWKRGRILMDKCRFQEAETRLLETLQVQSTYAEAHNLLGIIYFHKGADDQATQAFDEALRLDPKLIRARINKAFVLLRQGDFAGGWPDYELRFQTDEIPRLHASIPTWDGSDFQGRTLLATCEQGLGDVLQFLRFLPLVKAKGGRVVCEVPPNLLTIAKSCRGYDQLIAKGDQVRGIDIQISLMSLPAVLGTIDAPEPHLSANANLVRSWGQRLQSVKGFRIGVAWQGALSFPFDPIRSMPLKQFEAIAKIPGVSLVSLQKYDGVDQIAINRERVPLVDFGSDLDEQAGAFMDTAALMMNLDLIITSDSAVAHLAGSLGVPVWTAIHFAPEWRWFLNRDDSPWYPTMRLFRQTTDGDWTGVFDRIAQAVRDQVMGRQSSAVVFGDGESDDKRNGVPQSSASAVCMVPMSPGELLDKISILRLKAEHMTNPAQLENVRTELRALEICRVQMEARDVPIDHLVDQLKAVNGTLWQVEDELRVCERAQDFGERFIALARSVYIHNDRRAWLKREINISLGSPLHEEKTHVLPRK